MSGLKKNVIYNTLLSFSQILFPLITFPYAARILGPTGVGQVSFVDSLTQYFLLFAAVGIPLYGVREMAKIKKDNKKANILFSEIILLHMFMTIIFLAIYLVVAYFIDLHNIDTRLFIIGGGLIICNVFIIEWYYQSQEKFSFITKRTVVLRIIFIVAMFLLVKTKDDVLKYYFLFFALQFMNGLVNFFLVFKSGIKFIFKGLNIVQHFRPLLFLTACSVIGSIYVLLDNVLLGILSTATAVGYYSAAVKITKIPISLINALGIVLVPKLSESFANNDFETVKYYINSSIHYVLTLGIPLGIGIALTAKWTVLIVSGQQFESAIQIVQILSPIVPLIALNCIFFFQLFTPGNQEKTMIIILGVSAIVSVILNMILIPLIDYNGTAIATTLTEFSVFLISIFFARKLFNISMDFRLFVRPVTSSILFFPIIYIVDGLDINNIFKLCLGSSICIIVYFSTQLYIFKDQIVGKMKGFILKK